MQEEVAKELAVLMGKKLWVCRRAADMATFQFGSRTEITDYFGRPGSVGEYALHVQCDWRLVREDGIVVSRKDLCYPSDYNGEEIPSEFDWDKDPNRRDRLLAVLFEGDREFAVQSVDAGVFGSFRINFDGGLMLEVFPDDSVANEHWRLLSPTTEKPHFVFSNEATKI